MRQTRIKQQGVAAIWYIFLIGAIMSLGALAIEGTRYIEKKARLGDAMEAASIAVSTSDRVTEKFDKDTALKVAKLWTNYYIPDEKGIELEVDRSDKKELYGIDSLVTPYEVEYFRYDVSAKTIHDSWFRFSNWASFDEQVKVANKGTSGRIKGGHEPVDIVFVADYSGSMNNCLRGSSKEYKCRWGEVSKIEHLKQAITGVTKRIYNVHNESTFGFIPFTKRIVAQRNGRFYCASPLLSKRGSNAEQVRNSGLFSELLTKDTQAERNDFYRMHTNVFYSSETKQLANYYANLMKGNVKDGSGVLKRTRVANWEYESYVKSIGKSWDDIKYKHKNKVSDKHRGAFKFDTNNNDNLIGNSSATKEHVSITRSASEINVYSKPMFPLSVEYGANYPQGSKPKISSYCTTSRKGGVPNFYSIEREGFSGRIDVDAFNDKIRSMKAGGGTDMYQGLLAAPHQFYGAKNPNRYIIVLSDGKENNDTFKKLVKAGLCKNLKNTLKKENGRDKYNFKLFVVGIGLNQNNNWAYKDCFGDNIITVWDPKELEKRILGIITDDIGHNFERH